MDSALTSVKTILDLNTRLFVNCFADVSDEVATRVVVERTSTMTFVGVHCLDARINMGEIARIPLIHPFPEIAVASRMKDIPAYPPLPEILKHWQAISHPLLHSLGSLSSSDLQAPSARHFPIHDRTVLGALSFLAQHESYHIGQLALLRRLHGLPAMKYA